MGNLNLAMGVDIGGTHVTAALVDLSTKKVIPSSMVRSAVNAAGMAEEIIHDWAACMTAARLHGKPDCICIAMPGPFDYKAGISLMRGQAKYESLYELNVKKQLAAALGLSPQALFMDNDAACFLQGEVFSGAAGCYHDHTVIGVTLGTGLGSAVYRKGKTKNADKWAWPFRDGMAEDYLSTRWFVHRWKALSGETITGVKELTLQAARPEHETIFSEFAGHLASFLSDFISTDAPAAIIIGGNISKAFDRFGPKLLLDVHARHPDIKIERAALGEDAQLLGAVSSWLQQAMAFPG